MERVQFYEYQYTLKHLPTGHVHPRKAFFTTAKGFAELLVAWNRLGAGTWEYTLSPEDIEHNASQVRLQAPLAPYGAHVHTWPNSPHYFSIDTRQITQAPNLKSKITAKD